LDSMSWNDGPSRERRPCDDRDGAVLGAVVSTPAA
jgi:hypothetical protein